MSEASATTQEKDIPWEIAVLFFFLGWISTYADRMILNPLPILIRSEFVLTNARVGLISGLFVLTQPPSPNGKAKVIIRHYSGDSTPCRQRSHRNPLYFGEKKCLMNWGDTLPPVEFVPSSQRAGSHGTPALFTILPSTGAHYGKHPW